MKIGIIGLGYLGTSTLALLLNERDEFYCVEKNEDIVNTFSKGSSPIKELEISKMLAKHAERIHVSGNYKHLKDCEVVFICVDTPLKNAGDIDLTNLRDAFNQAVSFVPYECVLAIRSSIPIGTTYQLQGIARSKRPSGNLSCAYFPSFIKRGTPLKSVLKTQHYFFGVEEERVKETFENVFFHNGKVKYYFYDFKTMELAKLSRNSFLMLTMNYLNQLAALSDDLGISMNEVKEIMSFDDRINIDEYVTTYGISGSSIIRDTLGLYTQAKVYGYDMGALKASVEANANLPEIMLKRLDKAVNGLENLKRYKLLILGYTIRGNASSTKNSIAINIIKKITKYCSTITIYEPMIPTSKKLNYTHNNSLEDAVRDADLILILTDKEEINKLPPEAFVDKIIVDGINIVSEEIIEATKKYVSIGR